MFVRIERCKYVTSRVTSVLSLLKHMVRRTIFFLEANLTDTQLRWVQSYSIVKAIGQRRQVNLPVDTNAIPSSLSRIVYRANNDGQEMR